MSQWINAIHKMTNYMHWKDLVEEQDHTTSGERHESQLENVLHNPFLKDMNNRIGLTLTTDIYKLR